MGSVHIQPWPSQSRGYTGHSSECGVLRGDTKKLATRTSLWPRDAVVLIGRQTGQPEEGSEEFSDRMKVTAPARPNGVRCG